VPTAAHPFPRLEGADELVLNAYCLADLSILLDTRSRRRNEKREY